MHHVPEKYVFDIGDIVASTSHAEVLVRVGINKWYSTTSYAGHTVTQPVTFSDEMVASKLVRRSGWKYMGNAKTGQEAS